MHTDAKGGNSLHNNAKKCFSIFKNQVIQSSKLRVTTWEWSILNKILDQ